MVFKKNGNYNICFRKNMIIYAHRAQNRYVFNEQNYLDE